MIHIDKLEYAILIERLTKGIFDAQKAQKDSSIKKNKLLKEREIYISDLIEMLKKGNKLNDKQKRKIYLILKEGKNER